ncbi:MAG: tRNA lysidine(34) synthetase TilS [Chloroflexota bacterium]|nr:tRNA lysidine(34) synthetase TilS [Lentimicrobium sp.]
MLEQLQEYVEQYRLFNPGEPVLLAVSGGVDSMVLAELFHRAGYNFAIAHCNFGLRGSESNQDEAFVASMAESYRVRFFVKHFKTREYAGFNKISVQMAARTLRYEWFEELLSTEGFNAVATAHHLDDQIETFFINVLRGTGISGLHGILPFRINIIHPMMFAFRRQIEEFASDEAISYREDSSNRTTKYVRNKIRHDLIPLLAEINPEFRKTITSTIDRIREAELLLGNYIGDLSGKLLIEEDEVVKIPVNELKKLNPTDLYLYELLQPYNFNRSVCKEITEALYDIPGKQFFSGSHRILKDRDYLIITETGQENIDAPAESIIEESTPEITKPVHLRFSKFDNSSDIKLKKSSSVALLDASKLKYPLKLRKWREGDSFIPYGMTNTKKLSDYFIDNKFSIIEKENAWLLISGKSIAWLVGHRIANPFRITNDTEEILQIELLD